MCGRYTLSTPGEELAEVFGLSESLELEPRFNIAPTQKAPIVRCEEGTRRARLCRWGLIPYWAEETSIGDRLINARCETVADKPAYRRGFESRRCLVPADGFYESRREGRHKQPFLFTLGSGEPFAIAGLWERWRGEREVIESFTLLTADANLEVASVHDRMPLILEPESWPTWLDPEHRGVAGLGHLLAPPPDGLLTSRPVSTFVNSPVNDSPRCVETIDPDAATGGQARLF